MRILVAPDSFKNCMSAREFCEVSELAIKDVMPSSTVVKIPMANGSEGTVEAMCDSLGGKIVELEVLGPLEEKVLAKYVYVESKELAIIESASACGLELIPSEERNPYYTTTYGIGEIIRDAIDRGAKEIVLGLGNSATNDGGVGMLIAMGAKITNNQGEYIKLGGGFLEDIDKIDLSLVPKVKIVGACDVRNTLLGEEGCSYTFGAKKGASKEMMIELDSNLRSYAQVIKRSFGIDVSEIPGSGASGGLGAAVLLLGGELKLGIEVLAEKVELREEMEKADLIITGEGSIDKDNKRGKTTFGIACLGKSLGKPVVLFSGNLTEDSEELLAYGFTSMFSISNGAMNLSKNIKMAKTNLYRSVRSVMELVKKLESELYE